MKEPTNWRAEITWAVVAFTAFSLASWILMSYLRFAFNAVDSPARQQIEEREHRMLTGEQEA